MPAKPKTQPAAAPSSAAKTKPKPQPKPASPKTQPKRVTTPGPATQLDDQQLALLLEYNGSISYSAYALLGGKLDTIRSHIAARYQAMYGGEMVVEDGTGRGEGQQFANWKVTDKERLAIFKRLEPHVATTLGQARIQKAINTLESRLARGEKK